MWCLLHATVVQGKYSQADSLYLKAIEIAEKKPDPNHPVLEKKRAGVLEKQVKFERLETACTPPFPTHNKIRDRTPQGGASAK